MRKYFAEFIATLALVFFGTGAIITNNMYGGAVTHVGVSLVFGLTVLTMIYSVGDNSGAHLNPAVTFGFFASRLLSATDTIFYIISQFLGAISASLLLLYLFPNSTTYGETIPTIAISKAFVLEIILSYFLMFVIIHVATGSKEKGLMAGIAIGLIVTLEAIFAGPLTGASMNPARTLGPAIASGKFTHIWIYFTAPIIGSVMAIFTCKIINAPNRC